jgi:tetratricopeptide (TPR) repeat protein
MRKRLSTVFAVAALAGGIWFAVAAAEPTEEAKKSFNTAVEAAKAGNTAAAIAAYEEACKASPDYLQAHINVGAIYYEQSKLDLAANHLEAAVKIDSTSADAWKNLGLVYTQAGKFDQASAAFTRLGTIDAKSAAAGWATLGAAKKKKGDTAGAKAAYEMAIKADPSDSKSLYNLGNIQKDANQFDEAIATYKKAIAANPKYIEAYYNLAICSHQLDMESCVPDYEAFLKVAQGSSKWKSKVTEVQGIVKQIKDYLAAKGE